MALQPPMHQDMTTSRRQWGISLLVLGLMTLAVLFRLADFSTRNLWTDEAWVALAVLKPTPGEALAAGQSTPPFHLLAVWVLARVFGSSEAVLRSLSLFFGLGTVLLFWPLARTLTSRAAALMGLTALAFSPIMVYYSKELKQYSGDAFFAVLILLLTERLRASQGWPGWLLLALAGMVGLGFSHSLIFLLPVSLAALWFTLPSHRPRLALIALAWSGAFAVLYILFFRHQMDPELVGYWSKDFPDFSGIPALVIWLAEAWRRYLGFFLGKNGVLWGTPLLIIGFLHMFRHRHRLACFYLAGPLLLAFGASILHRYPFMAHYSGSRLMLFSAPMLYLAVASGGVAAFLFLWRRRGWRWLAPLVAGGILWVLNPMGMMQENFHPSFPRSQLAPLVQDLEAQLRPEDKVYVYYYAIHPFKYYYQGDLDQVYWGKSCVETGLDLGDDDNDDDDDDNSEPRRLWLIAGHYPDNAYMAAFAANLLGPEWRQKNCLTAPGAVLYRFERQETSMAKSPAAPPKSAVSGPPAPQPEKAYK
jgi:hypothetical protein